MIATVLALVIEKIVLGNTVCYRMWELTDVLSDYLHYWHQQQCNTSKKSKRSKTQKRPRTSDADGFIPVPRHLTAQPSTVLEAEKPMETENQFAVLETVTDPVIIPAQMQMKTRPPSFLRPTQSRMAKNIPRADNFDSKTKHIPLQRPIPQTDCRH
ncbi:hypothetical protein CEXT_477951 [Caerostris extrusa]|uniref:Uncharacterized protein n=1 Tax=Caerostris extrusa TaxID=172846 RepID=A0AAV4WFA1_CAEEX|nr:hypothetical protein CEXT_477951 [Caerostris extrusa]